MDPVQWLVLAIVLHLAMRKRRGSTILWFAYKNLLFNSRSYSLSSTATSLLWHIVSPQATSFTFEEHEGRDAHVKNERIGINIEISEAWQTFWGKKPQLKLEKKRPLALNIFSFISYCWKQDGVAHNWTFLPCYITFNTCRFCLVVNVPLWSCPLSLPLLLKCMSVFVSGWLIHWACMFSFRGFQRSLWTVNSWDLLLWVTMGTDLRLVVVFICQSGVGITREYIRQSLRVWCCRDTRFRHQVQEPRWVLIEAFVCGWETSIDVRTFNSLTIMNPVFCSWDSFQMISRSRQECFPLTHTRRLSPTAINLFSLSAYIEMCLNNPSKHDWLCD